MNLRYKILAAVAKNPGAPSAEICDVIDYDRQKVQYSVRECTKAGLLSMRRDDVTGQPGYTLTKAGQVRLAEGPEPQNKIGKPKSTSSTNVQPVVTHNTGSSASAPASATPAEGAAVQHEPAPETPAEVSTAGPAAEDDREWLDLGIATSRLSDELEITRNARDAYLEARDELRRDLDEIRALLAHRASGPLDPSDLTEVELAEKAADMIDEAVAEISRAQTALRDKDDELLKQACVVVELREQLAVAQEDLRDVCLILARSLPEGAYEQRNLHPEELAEAVADQLANQTALVAKLEHLLQSARNEAEYLRRHAEHTAGDPVNRPAHYQGKVECIDAIEAALGPDGFAAYCRGNAIKYTFRAGRKGPAEQDLQKAHWYLSRSIG